MIKIGWIWIVWLLWGFGRWLRYADSTNPAFGRQIYWHRQRHSSWLPVRCQSCSWVGPLWRAVHGYDAAGFDGDVEPVDRCPKCNGLVW